MRCGFASRVFWSAAFLLIISSCAVLTAQTLPVLKREIRVKPGDAVHLRIYSGYLPSDHRFISLFQDSTKAIDGEGNIELASMGKVHVAGMTSREVGEVLETKFKNFIEEPKVSVTPMSRLTLRGIFQKPGQYRIDLNVSFWELINMAGGLQTFDMGSIYIQRREETIYRDFEQAYYQGTSLYELGLESGDQLIAPRVNRLTMDTVIRYFQFGLSMLTFYVTMLNYSK
jgi:protein involved in polysaccharide export with SLBB domain